MLAMVPVRCADLDTGADSASRCALYRRACTVFEPAAGAGLPPDRQALFDRAKDRSADYAAVVARR